VTGLAGTEDGKTPIRALLHMSSGVDFTETYDGQDDVARLGRDLFGQPGKAPVVSVAQFNTRVAPPDTRWHYASSETEILGLVLHAVTGKPVAEPGKGGCFDRHPSRSTGEVHTRSSQSAGDDRRERGGV
jgi:hypothetical protein